MVDFEKKKCVVEDIGSFSSIESDSESCSNLTTLMSSMEERKALLGDSLSLKGVQLNVSLTSSFDDILSEIEDGLSGKSNEIEGFISLLNSKIGADDVITFNEAVNVVSKLYAGVVYDKISKIKSYAKKLDKENSKSDNYVIEFASTSNGNVEVKFNDSVLQADYEEYEKTKAIPVSKKHVESVGIKAVEKNVENDKNGGNGKNSDNSLDTNKSVQKEVKSPEQKLLEMKTSLVGRVLSFLNYTDADFKNILNGTNLLGVALFGIFGSNAIAGGHYTGMVNMLPRKWRIVVRDVQDKVMRAVGLRAKLITESEFEDILVEEDNKDVDFALKKPFKLGKDHMKITLGEESNMKIPKGKTIGIVSGSGISKDVTSLNHESVIDGDSELKTYIFKGEIPARTEFEGDVTFEILKDAEIKK